MSDEHEPFIKTPKQLIAVIVLSFVIPIALIVMLVSYVGSSKRDGAGSDGLTTEAIAQRIAPVAGLELVDAPAPAKAAEKVKAPVSKPAPAAPAATSATPVATAVATTAVAAAPTGGPDLAAGEKVYNSGCMACHAAGIAGAPKFGDAAAWEGRTSKGVEALTATVISGKGAMPPRGASSASDTELTSAVAYMLKALN